MYQKREGQRQREKKQREGERDRQTDRHREIERKWCKNGNRVLKPDLS